MATNKPSSNSRGLLLLLLTSGFFITGLLFDYMPMILDTQIKRFVELGTNEEVRSLWSKPPVEFHSYYWLYEALNADRFEKMGEKIRVRKTGPYHFTWRPEKRIIETSANKYRIIYNSTRFLYLNESSQQTPLDQPMVLLNAVYGSLLGGAREMSRKVDAATKSMLVGSANRLTERFNETLFMNMTAREALVGRRLMLIEKVRKMIETFGMDMKLPESLRSNIFGYVGTQNGSWSGPFEMYTGYQATMPSLGDLISYEGKRRLTEFRGRCNRLQVSAGELRPMPIGEQQTLEMFQPQFCRVIRLKALNVRKLREGLAIGYGLAREDFSSAQLNPDNQCFCQNNIGQSDSSSGSSSSSSNSSSSSPTAGEVPATDATASVSAATTVPPGEDYCSLDGAVELAPCSMFAPLVLTTSSIEPDARITSSIADFEPELLRSDLEQTPMNTDNSSSQLYILKRIGIPVKIDLTYTLFVKVVRDSQFRHTVSVPEVSYVPIVMVREVGSIPPALGKIIVNLESFLALTQHLKVVMYLSSVLLLCWLTGSYFNRYARDRVAPSSSTTALPVSSNGDGESLSERVNSADSNRSLPPSRMSRRSTLLDAATVNEDSASSEPRLVKQVGVANSSAPAPSTGARAEKLTRVFSRVEDELRWSNGLKEPTAVASAAAAATAAATVAAQLRPSETRRNSAAEPHVQPAAAAESGAGAAAAPGQRPKARKSWFMQVCSNFVRVLSGIRGTISEAGQLDLDTENAFRDKQLELLAGRIENWYSNSSAAGQDHSETTETETEEVPEGSPPAKSADAKPAASESTTDLTPQASFRATVPPDGAAESEPTSGQVEVVSGADPSQPSTAPVEEGAAASEHLKAEEVAAAKAAGVTPPTAESAPPAQIQPADGESDKVTKEVAASRSATNSGSPSRKDSEQSDQTVINNNNNNSSSSGSNHQHHHHNHHHHNHHHGNNRSDTSGEESSSSAAITNGATKNLLAANRDKETALEQMELAMAS